jgi:hypothetical protein
MVDFKSFKALRPPGTEEGSDTAAAARSAVRGCCVGGGAEGQDLGKG